MGKKEAKTKKEKKTKERKTKTKKDKNAPKRAISAFFFYQKERRETIKVEKPELDNKQIISTMSQEWNALKEADKKPYIEKAEADKVRYQKQKEEYATKTKATEKSAKKSSVKKGKKEESEESDE